MWFHLTLFRALGALGATAALPDLVQRLPGLEGELLSKTYSGYIPVGEVDGRKMNGGPGASSLIGSFTELGPYFLSHESTQTESYRRTGVPTLFKSSYRCLAQDHWSLQDGLSWVA
eukprot:s155_g30.t1